MGIWQLVLKMVSHACSEHNAIKSVFGERTQVLLCSWHLARRVEAAMRSHLRSKRLVKEVMSGFWRCVEAQATPPGVATIKASIRSMLVTCGVDESTVNEVIARLEGTHFISRAIILIR